MRFWWEYQRNDAVCLVAYIKRCLKLTGLITGYVNPAHSVKAQSAKLLACKVTVFSFVINKCFVKASLKLSRRPVSQHTFAHRFEQVLMTFVCDSYCYALCQIWFSVSITPSVFINWNLTERKRCLFSLICLFIIVWVWTHEYLFCPVGYNP